MEPPMSRAAGLENLGRSDGDALPTSGAPALLNRCRNPRTAALHPLVDLKKTSSPIPLATAFSTMFAADSTLVGAWQLDPEQAGQAALYLFTPTRYSMMLAADRIAGRTSLCSTACVRIAADPESEHPDYKPDPAGRRQPRSTVTSVTKNPAQANQFLYVTYLPNSNIDSSGIAVDAQGLAEIRWRR